MPRTVRSTRQVVAALLAAVFAALAVPVVARAADRDSVTGTGTLVLTVSPRDV